jgi:hypothetical protein
VGAILLLAGAVLAYRQISLSRDLKWARQEWAKLKPHHDKILAAERDMAAEQAFLTELDGWSATRVPWHAVLAVFQGTVPSNVQLTRLNVRGDWEFAKATAPAQSTTTEAADGEGAAKKEPPAIPMRMFQVEVGGRASGGLADEDVVRFANEIKTRDGIGSLFDSVKLQHLTKAAGDVEGGGEADRVFEIEGIFTSRKMP